MKKIAKLLIPVLAVACCGTTSTVQNKNIELREDLSFSEPALYNHYLESKVSSETGKVSSTYESGEKKMNKSRQKEIIQCNTLQECIDAGNSQKECEACIEKKLKGFVTLSLSGSSIDLPPDPEPCPEGHCMPTYIIFEEVCTICRVILRDPQGNEVGRSLNKMVKRSGIEGYVTMPIEITGAIKGNFTLEITRFDAEGKALSYQVEMNEKLKIVR